MIIEFSVKNFRSIKELQTLSMVAKSIKSKNKAIDEGNVINAPGKLKLLKSAAIYGANGSGKSNMVLAMIYMFSIIIKLMKEETMLHSSYLPFYYNKKCYLEPIFFQIQFILDGKKYRYGFEYDKDRITGEWLFGQTEKKEVYYFTRDLDGIKVNRNQFKEGKSLEDKTSPANLFLNVVKVFNGSISKSIIDYFSQRIGLGIDANGIILRGETINMLKNEKDKDKILELMNAADFGIENLMEEEVFDPITRRPEKIILSSRPVYDDAGRKHGSFKYSIDGVESAGTRKVFDYAGLIIRTLKNGHTLIVDELDARLHPSLTKKIVKIFNSDMNKQGAQLIFVTHDINLLDQDLLRRDQIYFTEKNSKFETCLYSLCDFKGIRNDASYEKDYIKGKYGAIPYLGNFEKIMN